MSERLLTAIVIVLFAGASMKIIGSVFPHGPVLQPVSFPHARHAALNMSCVSCHTGALEGTHAGVPRTQSCALCHRANRVYPPTPPELKVYLAPGGEIPWVQLNKAPRHVYFSHRRHVALGKLECPACHGEMKTALNPITQPNFPSGQPGMDRCIDCHRKEKVTTDCLSCHR